MAHFQDRSASSSSWIQELVRSEVHPEAERLLNPSGASFDPSRLIEESTIFWLNSLKELFQEYAKVFNAFSENNTKFQEIKIYALAQTAADFMLYRNQMKLIFTNAAHGVIALTCAHHVRSQLAIDGQAQTTSLNPDSPTLGQNQELLAQIGPFRDIYWSYQGEKISPEQVAKFYFIEFAKMTREERSSRGNKLLLEQIKSILKEQGMDL